MKIRITKSGEESTNGELAIGQVIDAEPVKPESLYSDEGGMDIECIANGFGGILITGEYEIVE